MLPLPLSSPKPFTNDGGYQGGGFTSYDSTIPALQGLSLQSLPHFQPVTIANPVKGLPKPVGVNKPAASNLFDPFLNQAKELTKDVLDYKLAIAQIKSLKSSVTGGKDNESSSPPIVYSGGGSPAGVGGSDGGTSGISTTMLILIGVGVIALFIAMRK